mmetsp:Transcript_55630/g.130344  ORF Transcript_55630/g.130344 Transcript_55630/m.130344 type:complete len:242 (+) Transcript_55630:991-1716(+)
MPDSSVPSCCLRSRKELVRLIKVAAFSPTPVANDAALRRIQAPASLHRVTPARSSVSAASALCRRFLSHDRPQTPDTMSSSKLSLTTGARALSSPSFANSGSSSLSLLSKSSKLYPVFKSKSFSHHSKLLSRGLVERRPSRITIGLFGLSTNDASVEESILQSTTRRSFARTTWGLLMASFKSISEILSNLRFAGDCCATLLCTNCFLSSSSFSSSSFHFITMTIHAVAGAVWAASRAGGG